MEKIQRSNYKILKRIVLIDRLMLLDIVREYFGTKYDKDGKKK
jgi:hypothetical protein